MLVPVSNISRQPRKNDAMNQIAPLLTPDRIVLNVEVGSKRQLFEWLGELANRQLGLDAGLVIDSLLAREKLGSTALGQGVAIPHGRIKKCKQAVGILLRMTTPLEFDAPDHLPVRLLFVLLVPAQANDLHLQILGELAQLLGDVDTRHKLMTMTDSLSVMQWLTGWQAWET